MHVAHDGVGAQATGLGHQFAAQFGAIDGDAGRRQAGIRALVDLHLRNIQAGGAEVQANLLAQGTQFIARTNDRQPRRAAAAAWAVARSTPARRRNKSKKRMATSIARTEERFREHAHAPRSAAGHDGRANAGAADERRFWRFTWGDARQAVGLRDGPRTPGPWDTPQPVQQARQTECYVILLNSGVDARSTFAGIGIHEDCSWDG